MTTATLSPSRAKVKFRLAGGAQPLILLPVEVNNNALGAKLDGILGYNLLRNYKVALDYPNETLSLFNP
jgi:hypothetical protein